MNSHNHNHDSCCERSGKPIISTVVEIKNECKANDVKSFKIEVGVYDREFIAKPGQFVMVWILGVDEVPMSIADLDVKHDKENNIYLNQLTISVKNVGEATQKIHDLKVGDKVGIRGPFGNSYNVRPGTAIVVGGGIGTASVRFLIKEIKREQEKNSESLRNLLVVQGCRNASQIIFKDWLDSAVDNANLSYCTDDGSFGYSGFCTHRLEEIIKELLSKGGDPSSITVYACGPEKMLYNLFSLCEKYTIELQASLERWMRCAFGVCGLCALEPLGLLVCKDGPVFSNEVLRKVDEFGKYHRDLTGKKFPL